MAIPESSLRRDCATAAGRGTPEVVARAVLRLGSPRRLAATAAFLGDLARRIRRRRAEPRLTVAVDVDALYETLTGVGWYLHELLSHLAHRDDLRLRLYGQRLAPTEEPAPPEPAAEDL
ncbi:MAG TPA: hypothetical protein VKY89_12610, partial [Thermoanaerobaculia bacterium]|nr:hypothetical protein [Thermoanaerobaculia bacterium]